MKEVFNFFIINLLIYLGIVLYSIPIYIVIESNLSLLFKYIIIIILAFILTTIIIVIASCYNNKHNKK